MYYQNYEDYMRSVLGYPLENRNTYEIYNYSEFPQMYSNSTRDSSEIMELYPDIYKIVNPMVCKICENNTKPITRELIDKMTDEIYLNLESKPDNNTVVNVKVNASVSSERQEKSNRVSKAEDSMVDIKENLQNREDRQRMQNDNMLRDLIRILILNQLLGSNFPNRPPRPQRPPMRPLFPRNDEIYEGYFQF